MLGPKCGDEETPSDIDQAFAAHGRRDANPVVNEAAELFGDLETASAMPCAQRREGCSLGFAVTRSLSSRPTLNLGK
jgi:hypothetical protein